MSETDPRLNDALRALRDQWGYTRFRPGQWEVIGDVLNGRDVLAVLPTGGGKSLLYQLPALLFEGLTLVISPLIALMEDQVAALNARGIPATFINSTLKNRELEQRWTDTEVGRYRLLYVSPERLHTERFVARAERLNVSLLAVDEAHCISEWGHNFRPAYLDIARARPLLGQPPTLAVTATATPQVRRDIVRHLELRVPTVLVRGFDRPNLRWAVETVENKEQKVLDVLAGVPGSGVVYAATRRHVEAWTQRLKRAGVKAEAYHAGLSSDARARTQTRWLQDELRVIVATNAFGMGIDKPDVRFVVHVDIPSSVEAYYQEAGRGGRDGEKAFAVLLYHAADVDVQRALIEESHPDQADVQLVYQSVCNLGQVPLGDQPETPVVVETDKISAMTGLTGLQIQAAVDMLARQGAWQVLPPDKHYGQLHFQQRADALRTYADRLENKALGAFLRLLQRTVHADAYTGWYDVDLRLLEQRSRLDRARLERGLGFLQDLNLLLWRAPETRLRVLLSYARTRVVPLDDVELRRDYKRAETKLNAIVAYAESVVCRRHHLLAYFGEQSPRRCGRCDICLGHHTLEAVTPAEERLLIGLMETLRDERPLAPFMKAERVSPRLRGKLLRWLVAEGLVVSEDPIASSFRLAPRGTAWLETHGTGQDTP